jgi:hypothetical protein
MTPLGGRRACARSIQRRGKIRERQQIFVGGEPVRFEAAHSAGRRRARQCRPAADDPAHRRFKAQTLGVIHILIALETPERRLTQQPDKHVPTVLATAGMG